jgi:hypothetical protein
MLAGMAARRQTSQQSVTAVAFVDEYVLATSGANDGIVKLWDLRKSFSRSAAEGQPMKSFLSREASATGRARGISSLSVNPARYVQHAP